MSVVTRTENVKLCLFWTKHRAVECVGEPEVQVWGLLASTLDELNAYLHAPAALPLVRCTLEQAVKVQRGSKGIAYSFFNLDSRLERVVIATPRSLYRTRNKSRYRTGG